MTKTPGVADEEDSDEDFPDAKLESSSESDEEDDTQRHSNLLLSNTNNGRSQDIGNESSSASEEEAEQMIGSDEDDRSLQNEISEHEKEGKTQAPSGTADLEADKVDTEPSALDAQSNNKSGHRHISARERRLRRKGVKPYL